MCKGHPLSGEEREMMKCPNCGFRIEKKQQKTDRSDPQNRYFHGVVLPVLAEYTGYTQEEMKAVVKWKFKVKSTAGLNPVEFEKFMSDVRQWSSAELSCYIPNPNEETK